jgi:hypothetical protein
MKSESVQLIESTSSISLPRTLARCNARNRTGSRCRLHVTDQSTGRCTRHRDLPVDAPSDVTDVSADLFGNEPLRFETPEQINSLLARIVLLLAKGRISPRRAAVITYACNLLLRCVVVIERKSKDEPLNIIWDDDPSPDHACQMAPRATDQTGDPHASSPYSRPQT